MGCSNSKDEEDTYNSPLPKQTQINNNEKRIVQATIETDPLLSATTSNISDIGAKVIAANDLTLSQTKHVHQLGTMNLTENPLMDVNANTNSNPLGYESATEETTSEEVKSILQKAIEHTHNYESDSISSLEDPFLNISSKSSSHDELQSPVGSLYLNGSQSLSGLLPEDLEQMKKILEQMLYITEGKGVEDKKMKARSRVFHDTCDGERDVEDLNEDVSL